MFFEILIHTQSVKSKIHANDSDVQVFKGCCQHLNKLSLKLYSQPLVAQLFDTALFTVIAVIFSELDQIQVTSQCCSKAHCLYELYFFKQPVESKLFTNKSFSLCFASIHSSKSTELLFASKPELSCLAGRWRCRL